jgi:hypothetical protein
MSTKISCFSIEDSITDSSVTCGAATTGDSMSISAATGVFAGAGGISVATIVGVAVIAWQAKVNRDISAIITNNLLLLFITEFLS